VVFWIERADGAVLLRRRPEDGLLGGLMEFPSTPWREAQWTEAEVLAAAPCKADWQPVAGSVAHGFTHFQLELAVLRANVGRRRIAGTWVRPRDLGRHALPTLMRRVARHMGIDVRPVRAAAVQLSSARSR
jgi:A/G-specific adenine glycosylase